MPITDEVDIDNLFNSRKKTPLEEAESSDNFPKVNLMGLARQKRKKAKAKAKSIVRRAIKRHCKRKKK